jgi:hypothetical protein
MVHFMAPSCPRQSKESQAATDHAEDFHWARFKVQRIDKVQRIEKHGSANDGSLLLDSGPLGKVKLKNVGVGESLCNGIFRCLDDLSYMRSVGTIGIGRVHIKDPEWNLAQKVVFCKAV